MSAFTGLAEPRQTFVAPQALRHSRPRDVRLTATGRFLGVLAVLLGAGAIAGGVALYLTAARQAESRRALIETGATVSGEVTRLWPNGEHRRRVEYRFVVDGRSYGGRVNVSSERRRQLEVGSPIPVRYVPGDPEVNDLGGRPRGALPMALPFVVSAILAALAALCLLAIRRERQLLTDGRVAPAVVTGHHAHRSSHGAKHRSMTYEFRLLSGAVASGKSHTSDKPPAIGSVICVVYDPDRPQRNAVYPLSLVRPAL